MAVAVLLRKELGHPERAAPGNDGDLINGVMVWDQSPHDGMPRLVEGRGALFLFAHDHGLTLSPHHDLVLGALELLHADQPPARPSGEERRLVHEVGEVRAGETGRTPSQGRGIDIVGNGHLSAVNLKDLLPASNIGEGHHHLAIEAARAQQRRVEHVRAVRGSNDDDAVVGLKAVHFHEQLV